MNINFGDHAHWLRQEFIHDDRLQTKLEALRERLHREGKALIGKRQGWTVFHARKGWR